MLACTPSPALDRACTGAPSAPGWRLGVGPLANPNPVARNSRQDLRDPKRWPSGIAPLVESWWRGVAPRAGVGGSRRRRRRRRGRAAPLAAQRPPCDLDAATHLASREDMTAFAVHGRYTRRSRWLWRGARCLSEPCIGHAVAGKRCASSITRLPLPCIVLCTGSSSSPCTLSLGTWTKPPASVHSSLDHRQTKRVAGALLLLHNHHYFYLPLPSTARPSAHCGGLPSERSASNLLASGDAVHAAGAAPSNRQSCTPPHTTATSLVPCLPCLRPLCSVHARKQRGKS